MKRYDELSHDELVRLADDGVQTLIDLEVAHAGIMPVMKPEVPSLDTEGIVKCADAFYVNGIYLENEEDALMVAKMSLLEEKYSYSIGYDYKWLDKITDIHVERKSFYKQKDVLRIQEVLQKNKTKKSEYDTQKKAYDKYLEEISGITTEVWGVVLSARKFQREVDLAKQTLEQYKTLADGDDSIACNFFANTYKNREDLIEHVLGKGETEE